MAGKTTKVSETVRNIKKSMCVGDAREGEKWTTFIAPETFPFIDATKNVEAAVGRHLALYVYLPHFYPDRVTH